MDVDRAGRLSRRQLITGTAALGAAALLSAGEADADTPPPDDATLLTKALEFERLTVLAYDHLVPLPVLSVHERHTLRVLARQDRAHARALESEMTARGIAVPAAPTGADAVDQALRTKGMSASVVQATTLKAAVQALLDIEALAQGGYYMLVRDAADATLALRASQALGNDAQHSMLLTQLVSTDIKEAVPTWYVTGVT
jgi:hypothetical protein